VNVTDYAPAGPLDREPRGGYAEPEVREAALHAALRGVELGAYDERIVAWMVRLFDDSTMRTLVSLIERARQAGGGLSSEVAPPKQWKRQGADGFPENRC